MSLISKLFTDGLPDHESREAEATRIAKRMLERNMRSLERTPTRDVMQSIDNSGGE